MKKLAALILFTLATTVLAETIIYLPPEGGVKPCIINGGVITCI